MDIRAKELADSGLSAERVLWDFISDISVLAREGYLEPGIDFRVDRVEELLLFNLSHIYNIWRKHWRVGPRRTIDIGLRGFKAELHITSKRQDLIWIIDSGRVMQFKDSEDIFAISKRCWVFRLDALEAMGRCKISDWIHRQK